jgi:hypothetical protein
MPAHSFALNAAHYIDSVSGYQAGLVLGAALAVVATLEVYQEELQEAIVAMDAAVDHIFDDIVVTMGQRGKRNVKHTEFEGMTDADVSAIARDPNRSPEERRKAREEEKGRKIRNRSKRR